MRPSDDHAVLLGLLTQLPVYIFAPAAEASDADQSDDAYDPLKDKDEPTNMTEANHKARSAR